MKRSVSPAALLLCAVFLPSPSLAEEKAPSPVTPYADLRLRLELVDQDGIQKEAAATTLRARAGLKTLEWHGLSALVEGEFITSLGEQRYNDTVNGKTMYPVVADPEDVLLNQAAIRWRPVKQIEINAGRQAVNIDTQRWIGSVGWRQNDQTLDAVRLSAQPMKAVKVDYLHAWRVNRVFGPDSPQGIWKNTGINGTRISTAIPNIGTLSGYGFWLDLPLSPSSSSRTLGVRMAGEHRVSKAILLFAVDYARQHDFKNNPGNFALDYLQIEPGITLGGATVKAGYERLEGNGTSALQTPLATLHAFNGWADKFLTTPANGLLDIYVDGTYKILGKGPLKGTSVRVAWHDFNSTRLGLNYGQEWNAMVSVPVHKRFTALAKLARYDARDFATDTTKVWLSLETRF